jgi:peptide/nickel transport system permease protein
LTYLLVIWIGITVVFFVPRFVPADPVAAMLGRIMGQASFMQPEQVQALRNSLAESFGLQGTLLEQYTHFLRRVLLSGDFGPSLAMYPTPVIDLIRQYLPWSLALLMTATIIAWVVGNFIGLLAGYWKDKAFSRFLEAAAIVVYPIPYYILALVLIICLAYLVPIFPFSFSAHGQQFSFEWFKSVIISSFLPALSIVLVGMGWWVISMKSLASSIAEEDFVQFARLKGVSDGAIMRNYVARNAMLPQITVLALQLGGIFSGALIAEILFGYPGVGTLMYQAVLQSDYNLMMGTISLSIVAVATATLVVDIAYPLLDPRIRHR